MDGVLQTARPKIDQGVVCFDSERAVPLFGLGLHDYDLQLQRFLYMKHLAYCVKYGTPARLVCALRHSHENRWPRLLFICPSNYIYPDAVEIKLFLLKDEVHFCKAITPKS